MRVLKLSMLTVTAVFALAGCMTSTSASLKGGVDASELRVVRTTSGLIWGPCMPAPGSVSSAYVIKLAGERSTYSPGEFRIFHELPSGARFPLRVDQGVIEVDRAK